MRKRQITYQETDKTYKVTDHNLHSVFESTAVKQHAALSVVILHHGEDWDTRPAFAMHMTDGDMLGTRSAYTMEYLALALATKIQLHS